MSAGRIPPQNLDAEQAVLGALLIDKEALPKVVEILHADSFYRDAHKNIYHAVIEQYQKNEPADLVTVSDTLRRMNLLDAAGGIPYLSDLVSATATAAHVSYHAQLVEEKATLRNLITAGSEIVEFAFQEDKGVDEILGDAENTIFNIAQNRNKKSFTPVKDILMPVMDRIEKIYENKGNVMGVPSGFPDLDTMTAGFQNSDLIILAARPSMGKTALALNFAQNVALRSKIPVAIFSLEMSKEALVQRILCSEAKIDSSRLRLGQIHDHELKRLIKAVSRLSEAAIYIDDTAEMTPIELKAKARRLQLEHGLGMILIDFLQLMHVPRRRSDNRVQEIAEISRALKSIGKELNIPVIALSQLSRAVEQRADKRPMLSDLRESGEIEQVADLVMFIHRDDYYDNAANAGEADLIIAKQRNGPTGSVQLTFRKEITQFFPREKHAPSDAIAPAPELAAF